ncbi:unnamed protein product, partial [marine sediment metagenome]
MVRVVARKTPKRRVSRGGGGGSAPAPTPTEEELKMSLPADIR